MNHHFYKIFCLVILTSITYPASALKKNYAHSSLTTLLRDCINFEAWGVHTTIDIHNCDPDIIRSSEKIREYAMKVCKELKINNLQEPHIIQFSREKPLQGLSFVQFLETSIISAQFANDTNHAYIDIFSCQVYNTSNIISLTKDFFNADICNVNVFLRT